MMKLRTNFYKETSSLKRERMQNTQNEQWKKNVVMLHLLKTCGRILYQPYSMTFKWLGNINKFLEKILLKYVITSSGNWKCNLKISTEINIYFDVFTNQELDYLTLLERRKTENTF